MVKRFLTIFFGVLVTVCLAQQDELVIEGFGEAASKDEALMAAKRNAIEKGIGMVLLSQTEIENFQVKRDQVITKTIGAVKSYEILNESKASDGAVQIKIKALISKVAMREDLAAFQILLESMDKPKIMIVINENNVGNSEPTNQAAEDAITKFLKEPYGFQIVDHQVTTSIKNSQSKMAELAGNPAAAAAIASQYGAEVLITGTAVSRKAEEISKSLGGMVSVQADVTIKAINCATGTVIGSESEHVPKVHISPLTAGNQAIGKAAEKAMGKLLDQIIKDWQDQLNNGIALSVSISGVNSFRLKNAIIQTISGLSGIGAVRERSWDAQSTILQIEVQYKGNTNGFCSKVDGYKMKSGGGSLSVTGVNGMAVTLITQAM